jgi:hypothetical protein
VTSTFSTFWSKLLIDCRIYYAMVTIQPNEDQKQRRKLSQYTQENKLLTSQYSRGEKSEKNQMLRNLYLQRLRFIFLTFVQN